MNQAAPHYLLFTEAKQIPETKTNGGRWRFVLEQIGTTTRIEEAEMEPGVRGERLQLLAVVRGLEALEQPSRVTLVTPSKYVGRGIRRGLTLWRQNDWQWENFGQMTPIKHRDLWKRIDRAMEIHQINCRVWQFDPPHVQNQSTDVGEQPVDDGRPAYAPLEPVQPTNRINVAGRSGVKAAIENNSSNRQSAKISSGAGPLANRGSGFSSRSELVKPIGSGRAYGYAIY